MANKIIGTLGQLGTGKTLYGIIWLYDAFCEGLPCGSNLKVEFKHKPLKDLKDIALNNYCDFYKRYGRNGKDFLDELWKLADNRKCLSLMSDLVDIILLKSRKQHRDIFYTQQFLQIDPRIAYITNEWITPIIYGVNQNLEISRDNPPEMLIVQRCDKYFQPLQPMQIDVTPYLDLYNSDEDPYIIKDMVSEEAILEIIEKLKEK